MIINLATGEVIGTLPLERGGTGGHDQQSALNNLLPYQGYYPGYILATDGSNASWSYLPPIIPEVPYDGNIYARQNGNWTTFSQGAPGGNQGDVQFNYYGTFYGDGRLNYDFGNYTLYHNGDWYSYMPRQISRASYYQYNDLEQWQDYYGNTLSAISHNGGFKPAFMYNWDADNNSIFYDYNNYRLAFKDQYGNVINFTEEAPYDGNYYARQNDSWVNLSSSGGGYPGGSYGDIQFNYYGTFYGESYLNYDFNNHILYNTTPDFYSYYPRQINRAGYYQYADLEQWQDYYGNTMSSISRNGGFKPAFMYSWDADNNSLFFDYNSNKLAFKDQYGSVYNFY